MRELRQPEELAGPSGPRLRIYRGGEEPVPAVTLGEFWAAWVLPSWEQEVRAGRRSPATIEAYGGTVRLWMAGTGDPPLAEITRRRCDRWIDALAVREETGKPRSVETVKKHRRHLLRLFHLAAEEDLEEDTPMDEQRPALMASIPRIEIPDGQPSERPWKPLSAEDVAGLIRASRAATTPRLTGIEPAAWWRALLVFLWNTGARIGTALSIEWPMLEHDPPRHGWWLVAPGRCMKGRRPGRAFVNQAAHAAAVSIRRDGEPRLFRWPHTPGYLQAVRRRLGLPGFHRLRASLGTWMTERAGGDPAAAQKQLGHASAATTLGHYVMPTVVAPALAELPQPKRRRRRRRRRRPIRDPQMRLF